MKQTLSMSCLLLITLGAFGQTPAVARPKITSIDHVVFYTTSPETNGKLYTNVLGLVSTEPSESGQTERFLINMGQQWIGYGPAPDPASVNRLNHISLQTSDCEAMRKYLSAQKVHVPNSCSGGKSGGRSFKVKDPEGHDIEFMERLKVDRIQSTTADPISRRIIHAGFIVRDRAAEDHFYKDILGFRPYWHGGMQNDRDDWVAMQVPDGTDWVEYMLNIKPDADQRTTGVMNHVSLSVKDIKAAQAKLEARGWKANDREHAQMGRDGKWQLNMYDPDQTRIELMEFTPAEKPCCSEFQGRHPSE
jgi:catechol 2,3-dioxygenase-like lactoylglutathione lyase family enzyme